MAEPTRQPISNSVPVDDPWNFVMTNFMGLAVYYAAIFTKVTKRYELFDDFKWEMIYAMVDVCGKYASRPQSEIVKIIKTVPRNYYGSKVCVKRITYQKESLDAVAVVENSEQFEFLYDKLYDEFLEDHYCLGDEASDEHVVLMEILYPSEEFQAFVRGNRLGMTRTTLGNYFRQKHKWSRGYFEKVFTNIKSVRGPSTDRGSRINTMTEEKIEALNKGGFMGDKTSILPKIQALVIKHPRAADVMAKITRHDDCFASLYKEDDPGCAKCIVKVEYEGKEVQLRDVCKAFMLELKAAPKAEPPVAAEAAPAVGTAEAAAPAEPGPERKEKAKKEKKSEKKSTAKKEVKVAKKEKAPKAEKAKRETLNDLALAALKKKAMTMPELSKAVGAPGTIYSVVNELIAAKLAGKRKDEGVRGTVFFAK